MGKKRLLIFASGSTTGGGSGFENLVVASRQGLLDAEIVGVVSNHEHGGVRVRAEKLRIHFSSFPGPWTAERYGEIARCFKPDFIALSGWLKLVSGLDPKITFNIHPGPLPEFGGPGMYGHHVHEAVLRAFKEAKIDRTAVSMHFVTSEYDRGPVFFSYPIAIFVGDTAEDIGRRVNLFEHMHQPAITNLVVQGKIYWDGKDPSSLHVPDDYQFLPRIS